MAVQSFVDMKVIDDPNEVMENNSPLGKPFLRLTFPNGTTVDISTNIAEMIGGAGAGLRKRWEDQQKVAH